MIARCGLLFAALAVPAVARAQTAADSAAMRATALVNGTRRGWGKETPADRRQKDVTILDIFGNAASVKAVMADWIDYLHIAKVDGRWMIVNVLWELKRGGKG